MRRPRLLRRALAATLLAAVSFGALALGAALAPAAVRHATRSTFRPRIGSAMGILPRLGSPEIASGTNIPVVYHGGQVMRNVTVHTIFWAPPGYHFDGSPSPGVPGYEAMTKQFLVDVAHDSSSPSNIFSTLLQYHDAQGVGSTQITYDPAVDSIDVSDPYPAHSRQCASPSSVVTCVTDLQLQQEIDRVVAAHAPAARGLHDIWFVLLPPDVDTCLQVGACATNAFAGYHSLFNLGHGTTVYAPIPDPLVELTPPPGSDPQGNPEAEATLNTVAHEAHEAITDPYGTGWMDPNGFETGDKCELGPQQGTPLGYAPDGSPYNQLVNGHQYLLQDMWSNAATGCVQSSTATGSALPLHSISLHQFSSWVSGSLGVAMRVPVSIGLIRGLGPVAIASTTSRPDGSWGPVQLRDAHGVPHAVGDDRDGLAISYGFGKGSPAPELIATGDGGNPFAQSGYTGWFALDHFFAVRAHSVQIGPCSQVGVLSLRVGATLTPPAAQLCSTESDTAVIPTPPINLRTPITLTSVDNRAVSPLEPNGALVKLTVALGEPGAVAATGPVSAPFATGFPTCTAYLRIQAVTCAGLVPRARYRLAGRRARAGAAGSIFVGGLRLHGGQAASLVNAAGRRLTTLHIARLRVDMTGGETVISGGTCQPGDFYGPPLHRTPTSSGIGSGPSGGGTICPASGHAHGLSTTDIAQTDDFSGGQTITQVPLIVSTAPIQDETLYGSFVASAQSGLPGAHGAIAAGGAPVALTITPAGSRQAVFHAGNVDTNQGVRVPALTPGTYMARWVLRDANGDTRTLTTRFVDQ
ncbi:MAG: hypothetical protein WCB67_10060 [Solirubrobacteraceae bacterium]